MIHYDQLIRETPRHIKDIAHHKKTLLKSDTSLFWFLLLTFCLHFTASCTIKDILMTQVEIAVEYFLVHGLQHYQHKDSGTGVLL